MGASSSGTLATSRSTIWPISARTDRSRARSPVQNSTSGARLSSQTKGKDSALAFRAVSTSCLDISGHPPPLGAHVVHEQVLTQPLGAGEERASAVDAPHLLDEGHEVPATHEHEGVDDNPLPGAALH